ncbi:cytochrome d ubiquinol oxidase subunit II [Marinomonas fungiae]|uniref:cytochrome d ubiquinol oxidase subunit II n=1 Tax=Marinomonas fungiae TaxID=1137284 RepID=UPI003A926E73
MDLVLFYFLLLGFAVLMYVLLDGFDLGVGILYPWFDQEGERDHLMRSISHVWDGNETWLVFGGVVLFAAFPAAYAGILSTFYLPFILMLFALIFRGVAFEYRFKAHRSRPYWDFAFSAGSATAAFCQGLILGSIIQGVNAEQISEASWYWLSPFSILTGFSVMAGYALLGASYLYMKSRNRIQQHAAYLAKRLVIIVMLAMLIVSLWTVLSSDAIRARWFSGWNFLYLSPLPILAIVCAILAWRGLQNTAHEIRPFWMAAGIFTLGFAGLVVSLFPYLLPNQLTIWQAASPDTSLEFLLVGIVIFVPLILAYTLWGYRVFAGKVEDYQEGY